MSFRKPQAVLETKKSIAHLLRISELACTESKALPEHPPGGDNRKECPYLSSVVTVADELRPVVIL